MYKRQYEYSEEATRLLDIHIGKTITKLRLGLGLTKKELGVRTGVSLPQVHKYEESSNRVSASRLYWFARALRTSPSYFFDSFITQPSNATALSDNEQEPFWDDLPEIISEKEELLDAYFSIENKETRLEILKFIRDSH